MTKRLVEVFIAGCPLFVETVKMMRELAYSNCEVKIYNIHKESAAEQKKKDAIWNLSRSCGSSK